MAVFQGSRYTSTSAHYRNGDALILDIRTRRVFDMTNATYYTVVEGDTLDGISYNQYGKASMMWALLDANPKFQSELDIKPGDVLAIPPLSEVLKFG
jgi:phage tail protein X